MRLFGRPDLSCRDVRADELEGLQSIFNGLMRMMAAGALIPDGQPVRAANSDEILRCYGRGDLEDAEFNNAHLALEWENSREQRDVKSQPKVNYCSVVNRDEPRA